MAPAETPMSLENEWVFTHPPQRPRADSGQIISFRELVTSFHTPTRSKFMLEHLPSAQVS